MSDVSFDPTKNERNIASRGIAFEVAEQFEWDTSIVAEDLRNVHVISLRKANRREMRRYEAEA